MKDLYDFLKLKLKEKNVRVDELVKYSDVSRTTLYRMMKGMLEPTRRVYDAFVKILDLDAKEQQQLDHYIKRIHVTEDQLLARNALNKMFFKSSESVGHRDSELELVAYSDVKTIISYDELFAKITEASAYPDFQCEIKIVNCAKPAYLSNILRLMQENANGSIHIEHLLNLSENECEKNVSLIAAVLPFIKYDHYTMLYFSSDICRTDNYIFSDIMLIRYKYSAENMLREEYMVLSFEEEGYSDCWIADCRTPYEFFLKKYKLLKNQYQDGISTTNIDFINDYLAELSNMGATHYIKPNPCFHRVPISILESLLQRLSKQNKNELLMHMSQRPDQIFTYDMVKEQLLVGLQYRGDLSRIHEQIDVYTKDGLETFAREGKFSDHFYYLPKFSKKEIKDILQSIQEKHNDPQDRFQFFITYTPLSDDCFDTIVFENNAFLIAYHNEKYCCKTTNCFLFEQMGLARTVTDFIKNYIPENMVMSQSDADDFIGELIEKYCS